ncbi:hypothetical protein T265_10393 [Opisthorchis viverrini]|uniref:Uncharacterized protein n=1 Tax=Opisthorchis viverrini TaxID=6198 RepID=A0A074Z2P4_OPIVI|nr:hypothetical protein T265_10393 [Opisthorchis viverrini]KER21233.1 hypothetical protein T265_10393 [Opisthorchis viverrini]
MHYHFYGTSRHMFQPPTWYERLCECRETFSSIAQWIAEVRKPSHHGKVQSLRDGGANEDHTTLGLMNTKTYQSFVNTRASDRSGCVAHEYIDWKVRVSNSRLHLDFSCLGLGNLVVSQLLWFLRAHNWRKRSPPFFPILSGLLKCTLEVHSLDRSLRLTLSVPNCRAARGKHEDWDTARLPKPRQGKSIDRGQVRTTDYRLQSRYGRFVTGL